MALIDGVGSVQPVRTFNAIVYFVSDQTGFLTGARLHVDGGRSIQ